MFCVFVIKQCEYNHKHIHQFTIIFSPSTPLAVICHSVEFNEPKMSLTILLTLNIILLSFSLMICQKDKTMLLSLQVLLIGYIVFHNPKLFTVHTF